MIRAGKKKLKSSQRNGLRKREILKTIIRLIVTVVAVPTVTAALVLLPNSPIALKAIIGEINRGRKRPIRPAELRRLFEQLKREQVIDIQETESGLQVTLRKNGVRQVVANNLDQLRFTAPTRWDRRWRIVVFDIPEHHRKARDAFVQKLRELSFYPLQKSVFVFPYPPVDLINFLSSIFEIRPYVRIIEATTVEGEAEMLAHFKLRR